MSQDPETGDVLLSCKPRPQASIVSEPSLFWFNSESRCVSSLAMDNTAERSVSQDGSEALMLVSNASMSRLWSIFSPISGNVYRLKMKNYRESP